MKQASDYIVRTGQLADEVYIPIKHVLNPKSSVKMAMLSEQVGMQRIGINLGRIPPGSESFLPHAHQIEEEFLYILEGTGEITIGDDRATIAPGDFIGFPTDGAAHQLANTGTTDLVYLMGGERAKQEIVDFPTVNKWGIAMNKTMHFIDKASVQKVPYADFVDKEKRLD